MASTRKGKKVQHEDALQRINFLFQAAAKAQSSGDVDMARSYVTSLRAVSRRLVLRIAPSMKRLMCPKCNALAFPDSLARYRLHPKGKGQKHVSITCLHCKHVRRIPYEHVPAIMQSMSELSRTHKSELQQCRDDNSSNSRTDGCAAQPQSNGMAAALASTAAVASSSAPAAPEKST